MNSFYIEYNKIKDRPEIIEWLDRCGVTWANVGITFSHYEPPSKYLFFAQTGSCYVFMQGSYVPGKEIHCQTAEEFCERIAEVMGLEKPRFGNDTNVVTKEPILFEQILGFTDYPHKTYRILDSLDGIPLDKRMTIS